VRVGLCAEISALGTADSGTGSAEIVAVDMRLLVYALDAHRRSGDGELRAPLHNKWSAHLVRAALLY
jgi:hypothetical protein